MSKAKKSRPSNNCKKIKANDPSSKVKESYQNLLDDYSNHGILIEFLKPILDQFDEDSVFHFNTEEFVMDKAIYVQSFFSDLGYPEFFQVDDELIVPLEERGSVYKVAYYHTLFQSELN